MPPPPHSFDFAVIGGGLVGASIAYGLAKAGKRVAVLDEGDMAVRASRGNFALVWVQGKGLGNPAYAAWTRHSSAIWPDFADELRRLTDLDVRLEQPGGFTLCLSEAELEARDREIRRFHNQPGGPDDQTGMLDRERVRAMLPAIGPEVVGGSFNPRDGHVNSLRLYRALHDALARLGVAYRPGHAVRAIRREEAASGSRPRKARWKPDRSSSPPATPTASWPRWWACMRRCARRPDRSSSPSACGLSSPTRSSICASPTRAP